MVGRPFELHWKKFWECWHFSSCSERKHWVLWWLHYKTALTGLDCNLTCYWLSRTPRNPFCFSQGPEGLKQLVMIASVVKQYWFICPKFEHCPVFTDVVLAAWLWLDCCRCLFNYREMGLERKHPADCCFSFLDDACISHLLASLSLQTSWSSCCRLIKPDTKCQASNAKLLH